ncbi:P-loop NTPase fold protein [Brucella pseudogrignonensis]|uniref:KAP family P-loop NTPase fold protein n=1 Tax=Brucella pseudogrignonensis TaxID=419475 RepID=UPI0038D03C8F
MRYSDRPISHPQDDVLGRSTFALALARSIYNLSVAQDGFVIGLFGPWGAGKSSVVELTLRYLRHLEMQQIAGEEIAFETLDQMSDQFALVKPKLDEFLDRGLDANLWDRNHSDREFCTKCGSAEKADLAKAYWSLTKAIELKPRNIVIKFSPWLVAGRAEIASALISDMGRELGEKLGAEVREAFAALLERLAQVVPLAGAAVDVASGGALGGLFSNAFDVSNRMAKRLTSGRTLESVREALRRKLHSLEECKILVVIDDLDRLTPDEAVEMISLVKGLGDLPNVVYLLCCDEKKLSHSLGSYLKLDGREYLEKIIQYPVHLPTLNSTDLSGLLSADLSDLLPSLKQVDQARLSYAWFSIIRAYVYTPRDVRRLVNSYSMAIAGLSDHTDPIELLVLETIRLNEPTIYEWVRQNIDELAG